MPNSDKRVDDVRSQEDLAALLQRDRADHPAHWSDAELAKFLGAAAQLIGDGHGAEAKSAEAPAPPVSTAPETRSESISLESWGRALGKMSRSSLIVTYALTAGTAMGVAMFGANIHNRVLALAGGVFETLITAVLVGVATWYRRDNAVHTAISLAVAWMLARVTGAWCATILLSGRYDAWVTPGSFVIDTLFGLPTAIPEAFFLGGVLVLVLRRVPPPFAPPGASSSIEAD